MRRIIIDYVYEYDLKFSKFLYNVYKIQYSAYESSKGD